MKTFTRRRKTNQPEELTNGTPEKKVGSLTKGDAECETPSKDPDGAGVLEFITFRDEELEGASFPENEGVGAKRRFNGEVNKFQRKAARLECSPPDTDAADRLKSTPRNFSAAAPSSPEAAVTVTLTAPGPAPKLRPRGGAQPPLRPPSQQHTRLLQPPHPPQQPCPDATLDAPAVCGSSAGLSSQSHSFAPVGRSLFSCRPIREATDPATSLRSPPTAMAVAMKPTPQPACSEAQECWLSGKRSTPKSSVQGGLPAEDETPRLGLATRRVAKELRSPIGSSDEGYQNTALAAAAAVAGVQPLWPRTARRRDGASPASKSASAVQSPAPVRSPTTPAPLPQQQQQPTALSQQMMDAQQLAEERLKLQQQQQEVQQGAQQAALILRDQTPEEITVLEEIGELPEGQQEAREAQQDERQERQAVSQSEPLEENLQRQPTRQHEQQQHDGARKHRNDSTPLTIAVPGGASQQSLATAPAGPAIADVTAVVPSSAPSRPSSDPIPTKLLGTVTSATHGHATAATEAGHLSETAAPAIPATAFAAAATTTAVPATATTTFASPAIATAIAATENRTVTAVAAASVVAGSGRAGRPIGRGRLPSCPPIPGAPQGALPVATSGGSKVGGASQSVHANATTPQKSNPASGLLRGASSSPVAGHNTAMGARQAAGLLGAGIGVSSGFGGVMLQGGDGGGGGSIRVRMGSQPDAGAVAHSIMEAQERGELLQLQDDAQYALDGLISAEKAMAASGAPGGGGAGAGRSTWATAWTSAIRISAVTLAGILATRRGRAALSQPVNLAMKALTSLARLAVVPRDPVTALAAAVILLSLVQEDALPTYSASYAAAVLLRHVLLQSQQDPPPELQFRPQDAAAAAAVIEPTSSIAAPTQPGLGCDAGGTSASALLRSARGTASATASGGGGGGGGSSAFTASMGTSLGGGSCGGRPSGGGSGNGDDGTVSRVLRLVQEGPLARHVGRTDLVEGPMPLVLLAMAMASEATPSRIKYAERFKDNLSKVGILPLLGTLVTVRRDAVVRHVCDKRVAGGTAGAAVVIHGHETARAAADFEASGLALSEEAAAPALADPSCPPYDADSGEAKSPMKGGLEAQILEECGGVHGGSAGAEHGKSKDPYLFEGSQPTERSKSQPPAVSIPVSLPLLLQQQQQPDAAPPLAAAVAEPAAAEPAPLPLWCLWELQLLLRVLENATFTHKRNEDELLALRVSTAMPLEHTAAALAAAASAPLDAPPAPPSQHDEAVPRFQDSQPRMGSQELMGSHPSQQTLELMDVHKLVVAGDNDTAVASAPAAADARTPFVAVLVDLVRQLADLIGEGDTSGAGGREGVGAALAVSVPPSAAAVCQVGVAVLMNLTHEHPDGVAVVAASGGLQAVGGLVWRCCRPQLVLSKPNEQQEHGGDTARASALERSDMRVCRDRIVSLIEVLSVCLGLLINMTSKCAANQRALRTAVLLVPPPATAASLAQSSQFNPVNSSQPSTSQPHLTPGMQAVACPPPPPQPPPQDAVQERDKSNGQRDAADVDVPRMVPLLCAVLNAMSHKPSQIGSGADAAKGPPQSRPDSQQPEEGGTGGNASLTLNDLLSDPRTDREAPGLALGTPGAAPGGGCTGAGCSEEEHQRLQLSPQAADEVTEEALDEDLQGGQASIAQVYSAILLGYLIAGTDAERGTDVAAANGGGGSDGGIAEHLRRTVSSEDGSAAAARAEARRLLVGGSLRLVARGISRCLEFYCQAEAITERSRDSLVELLKRLLRFEDLENPLTGSATAAAAIASEEFK